MPTHSWPARFRLRAMWSRGPASLRSPSGSRERTNRCACLMESRSASPSHPPTAAGTPPSSSSSPWTGCPGSVELRSLAREADDRLAGEVDGRDERGGDGDEERESGDDRDHRRVRPEKRADPRPLRVGDGPLNEPREEVHEPDGEDRARRPEERALEDEEPEHGLAGETKDPEQCGLAPPLAGRHRERVARYEKKRERRREADPAEKRLHVSEHLHEQELPLLLAHRADRHGRVLEAAL